MKATSARPRWKSATPGAPPRVRRRRAARLSAALRFALSPRDGRAHLPASRRRSSRRRSVLARAAVHVVGQLQSAGLLRVRLVASVFIGVPIAFAFGAGDARAISRSRPRAPLTVVISRMDEGMSHLILLVDPAVHLPRPADRDDRHGARDGRLPRHAARPCARRALLCAARRDVSWCRAFPARRPPTWRRSRPVLFPEMKKRGAKPGELVALLAASGAHDRDDPAEPRADHHRLGHRRLDRRAVHRRPAAGAGARRSRSASSPMWRSRRRRPLAACAAPPRREIAGTSGSRCRRWCCRSSSAAPWSRASRPRPKSRPSASPTR